MNQHPESVSLSSEDSRANLFWVDLLRAAVIFGVIVIHTAADVITEWGALPKDWWWAANIYDSLVRGCVPVFVMVSGALLLPKTETLRDFFRKRFHRIAIPFIVWTALYLIWKKLFYLPNMGLAEAFSRAAENKVCFHLWFLYIIAGLYLVTPVFRILIAHASGREIFYFLALWFVMSSLLPFAEDLSRVFTQTGFQIQLPVEPVKGFIGYFVLGYFLWKYAAGKFTAPACAVWITSLTLCAAGTYFLSRHFHSYQGLLYDNMAPNVVFYAASFFMLVTTAGPFLEKHLAPRLRELILLLSKASFGIYLIHPMILDTLIHGRLGFALRPNMPHPVFMIPLVTGIVYLLSFLAIFLIQKIPRLRNIV